MELIFIDEVVIGKPKVIEEIFDYIQNNKPISSLPERFKMKAMTKEEAIEKAKKVYWISDIIYGKLKKDQKNNHWYGISVPKCLQDFDKMEMIDANTNILRIREPVDCNYHRSQIIILSPDTTKEKSVQVFLKGYEN